MTPSSQQCDDDDDVNDDDDFSIISDHDREFVTELELRWAHPSSNGKRKKEEIPLVEFMYLVFTRMPGESYRRRLGSSLLRLCYVFRALITSLVCWFWKRERRHDRSNRNVQDRISTNEHYASRTLFVNSKGHTLSSTIALFNHHQQNCLPPKCTSVVWVV